MERRNHRNQHTARNSSLQPTTRPVQSRKDDLSRSTKPVKLTAYSQEALGNHVRAVGDLALYSLYIMVGTRDSMQTTIYDCALLSLGTILEEQESTSLKGQP